MHRRTWSRLYVVKHSKYGRRRVRDTADGLSCDRRPEGDQGILRYRRSSTVVRRHACGLERCWRELCWRCADINKKENGSASREQASASMRDLVSPYSDQ